MEWSTSAIRSAFLEFFEKKGHEIVSSAPIVIKDDPTLMFTNAGMNQFKGVFIGNENAKFDRIVDSQKCLRVSGKHNDLEEVGRDHYHHTMFEMLGNWSFGDYFKEEAIDWAWELLTSVYGLDSSRMYVSVFSGDEEMKLGSDNEAKEIWQKHMANERILEFGRKENFWEMGEIGPCGPCSEIHYDLRSKKDRENSDGAALVNADHPEVIEIWNLVFMQYNRLENGSLQNLKSRHIDTGMGLERLARVLQNANSNYEIDVFKSIINDLSQLANQKYSGSEAPFDVAYRVIADHIRTIAFTIADGQLPSNTGAGYVIRRVLRRAIRYGYSQLDIKTPFLGKLIDPLILEMGDAYTELSRNAELIKKVITEEEKTFLATLDRGLARIGAHIQDVTQGVIEGDFAFELLDTYGFPIDLTQLIASESGLSVDMVGFSQELEKQKTRSRAASKAEFGDWKILITDDNSTFVGYDRLSTNTHIAKYRDVKVKGKEVVQYVLLETPFYAESGGQVGDKGSFKSGDSSVKIFDTKKENGEIIHYSNALLKNMSDEIEVSVSKEYRTSVTKNHTSTHLLHKALRDVLGTHVEQKGSLVASNKLRFDFSHFEKITENELESIEDSVLSQIQSSIDFEEWREMPVDKAKEMGAMALFGEKYGDEVRVVKFGDSIELCGGTHVDNSSSIGGFKILTEGSVASGIRRVEAISGPAYDEYVKGRLGKLENIEKLLGDPTKALEILKKLKSDLAIAESLILKFSDKEKSLICNSILDELKNDVDTNTIVKELDSIEGKALKEVAHQVIDKNDEAIVVLGSSFEDKVSVVVGIGKSRLLKINTDANKVIKSISPEIQGGGGGQPFLAMAGGKNKKGLKRALEMSVKLIKN
ncbi:alanine--tRNA ligase [Salibacteraceae bacterium]|nr:alanine--tRNA ligase [Salibacteraceae bacterium]